MNRILHPSHSHPLTLKPIGKGKGKGKRPGSNPQCLLCRLPISSESSDHPPVAYSCRDCAVFIHKSCALSSPLPLDGHPFHPDHPLLLLHTPSEFDCPACKNHHGPISKYGCVGCGFYLDLYCALSVRVAGELTPPDAAAIQSYLANEHSHPLTRFFAARPCYLCILCQASIQGEGYICLEPGCKFHAHEGCIRGLYYEDGTRIPRVAHEHQLFTHHDTSCNSQCKICNLKVPGEKIGCQECGYFYHRMCLLDVADDLDYPPHSAHPLTLSIDESNYKARETPCRSCGGSLVHHVVYGCSTCLYFLHVACTHRVLGYLQGGTETETWTSWHRHPLLPFHGTSLRSCCCCGGSVEGLGYECSVDGCGLLLHPSCLEPGLEIKHPHHPEHPLVLLREWPSKASTCDACRRGIAGFRYYCAECDFSLDTGCASAQPDKKHELHEHQLARFQAIPSIQCNVCGEANDSGMFRCVRCNFNIHEGCMILPQSVKHKYHDHKLHLQDHYVEDDSGEYRCEICTGLRNPMLGVYVCRECKDDNLYVAHMECALSRVLVARKWRDPAIARLELRMELLEREVTEIAVIEEELEQAREERAKLLSDLLAHQPFYNKDP